MNETLNKSSAKTSKSTNVVNSGSLSYLFASKKNRLFAGVSAVALALVAIVVFVAVPRSYAATPTLDLRNADSACDISFLAEASSPSGYDEVHKCTFSNYFSPKVDLSNVRILAVGGGGAGGSANFTGNSVGGGGGGAGGFVDQSGIILAKTQSYKVTVGAGGTVVNSNTTNKFYKAFDENDPYNMAMDGTKSAKDIPSSPNSHYYGTGNRGQNSSVILAGDSNNISSVVIYACGGGAGQGANNSDGYDNKWVPNNLIGASSGGGYISNVWGGEGLNPGVFANNSERINLSATPTNLKGVPTIDMVDNFNGGNPTCANQGNVGGVYQNGPVTITNNNWYSNAGGGGAGARGANANNQGNASSIKAGDGGAGRLSAITGSNVCLAGGGGGGGHYTNSQAMRQGLGGQNLNGAVVGSNEGDICLGGGGGDSGNDNTAGAAGGNNTGGGGGGGIYSKNGGSGGSGLIVFRFHWQEPSDTSLNPQCQNLDATLGDICINKIVPAVGPLEGGNTVTIFGNGFPYTQTNEYVNDGLVAHFDAINNTGNGDLAHSTTTTSWKNLAGTRYLPDAELCSNVDCSTKGIVADRVSWTENSTRFSQNNTYTQYFRINKVYNPANYTIEVLFSRKGQYVGGMMDLVDNWQSGNMGLALANNNVSFQQYLSSAMLPNYNNSTGAGYRTVEYSNYDNSGKIKNASASLRSLSTTGCDFLIYSDGVLKNISHASKSSCALGTASTVWGIGVNMSGSGSSDSEVLKGVDIYSVRVYSRSLRVDERVANAKIDKTRFSNHPVVRIGGNICRDLQIISTKILKCKVPAGSQIGATDVDFSWEYSGVDKNLHLPGAYHYSNKVETSVINALVATPSNGAQTIDVDIVSSLFSGDSKQYLDVYRSESDTCGFDLAKWEDSYSDCKPIIVKHVEKPDANGDYSFVDDPGLLPDGSHAKTLTPNKRYYYTAVFTNGTEKFIFEPDSCNIGPR